MLTRRTFGWLTVWLCMSFSLGEEVTVENNGETNYGSPPKTILLREHEAASQERDNLKSQLAELVTKRDGENRDFSARIQELEKELKKTRQTSEEISARSEEACNMRNSVKEREAMTLRMRLADLEGKSKLTFARLDEELNKQKKQVSLLRAKLSDLERKSKETITRLTDETLQANNMYYEARAEYFKTLRKIREMNEHEENQWAQRLFSSLRSLFSSAVDFLEKQLPLGQARTSATTLAQTARAASFSSASTASASLDSFLSSASSSRNLKHRSAVVVRLDSILRQTASIICAYCLVEEDSAANRWIYSGSKFVLDHTRHVVNWAEIIVLSMMMIWFLRMWNFLIPAFIGKGKGR